MKACGKYYMRLSGNLVSFVRAEFLLNWSIIDEVTTRNTTAHFLAHSVDINGASHSGTTFRLSLDFLALRFRCRYLASPGTLAGRPEQD